MKEKEKRMFRDLMRGFLLWTLFCGCLSLMGVGTVAGETGEKTPGKRSFEITPGPRMIRAVEALANDYLAAREALTLSPEQVAAIHREVVSFKKDIWRKEAVLTGMFAEVALKRRHGLLSREEYQMANQLTGGIESDELGRLIRAITTLQETLTPEQKELFRMVRKPQVTLGVPEGVNTRIGLMALGRYGRAYGEYRGDLDLSGDQMVSLHSALEEARRELIRIGTDIEVSRTEAYDLLKEPVIDPGKTQRAMDQTARLEGVFFARLSEMTQKLDSLLTQSQRVQLAQLEQTREKRSQGASGMALVLGRLTLPEEGPGSASLVEHASALDLSPQQIKSLVALETATLRHELLDRAELQIQNLELMERIAHGESGEEIEAQIDRIGLLAADIEKDRLRARIAGLTILNEKQKLAFHNSLAE